MRVNGETRAEAHTRDMLFTFEEVIADAAQDETIYAGEVFGSGTVGNCCGLEIGRFLESGDVVELEVEKIGALRTKVVRNDSLNHQTNISRRTPMARRFIDISVPLNNTAVADMPGSQPEDHIHHARRPRRPAGRAFRA